MGRGGACVFPESLPSDQAFSGHFAYVDSPDAQIVLHGDIISFPFYS